ncbi:hypothetical protein [Oceanobacillus sp. FSL W7-1293]|uniref:hypothetical protein n=1 Tax=Oceanobacillus TaxID=182709 RepID=UPI0030CEE913
MSPTMRRYIRYALVLLLSVALILFAQEIKLIKNPDSTPITSMTFVGLGILWLFSFMGVIIADLMKLVPIKVIRDFPILGWVSITSLTMCLISDFFVEAIQSVDFLAITTPILTVAGISVANRLVDLRRTSWKIAIVAVFVFAGTYLCSALLAQLGLFFAGN